MPNPPVRPSDPPPAAWPLHILYADSVLGLRELMRDRLELDGHRVETAANSAEALALLTRSQPAFDLIIADHNLQRVDGLDLVWHVRQLPYAGKIIILSSGLSPAVAGRYQRFGVNLLLTKPIFPPTFCQMLHQMFPPNPARPTPPALQPVEP